MTLIVKPRHLPVNGTKSETLKGASLGPSCSNPPHACYVCVMKLFREWRKLLYTAALATFAFNVISCNSPTLPLPPPGSPPPPIAPEISLGADGYAVVIGVKSAVDAQAQVICFNTTSGQGVGTTANVEGAYSLRIQAAPGDVLELWQRAGSQQGPSLGFPVH